MDAAVRRKALGLLGLGARARTVAVGVPLVRMALSRGRLALVVLAADASRNSREKVVPLANAKGVGVVEAFDAAEIGHAVGREGAVVVGVLDRQLAQGIRAAMTAAH